MTEHNNVFGYRDLYDAVIRVETKVDERLNSLDSKVDNLTSRQDRLEGRFDAFGGILKWLGLPGLAGFIAFLLWQAGVILQ